MIKSGDKIRTKILENIKSDDKIRLRILKMLNRNIQPTDKKLKIDEERFLKILKGMTDDGLIRGADIMDKWGIVKGFNIDCRITQNGINCIKSNSIGNKINEVLSIIFNILI